MARRRPSPIILADRRVINSKIVKEWIAQARTWWGDPDATEQQKRLAWAVLNQWGIG